MTQYADNSENCDYVDVTLTILHEDPEVTALESEYIYKKISKTQLQFQQATDNTSLNRTLKQIK